MQLISMLDMIGGKKT
ncbi:hypothetical protein [Staphylococcus aureus]